MCGIAGYLDPGCGAADRESAVRRMCAAMAHRGPDEEGLRSQGPLTLGLRRLAIFDPANGHQPMTSPDGRLVLVFNGAIYNFRDLRRDLEPHWPFRTACDTEVLLAAYARWGSDCLDRLRGMYAFAVWDAAESSLFLARDPFGIKPLYYRRDGERLLFASELTGLYASGAARPEIDPAAVSDYLGWFAVPAPRTIYRDSFALRPGECATLREGRLQTRRTWSFGAIAPAGAICSSRADFIAELRARLEDAVKAHLSADVPVGAFLSGGLDSAAIVGLMTRVGGGRLRTFSIGFDEPGCS
ncbi:MAG: asparagine synthase (glutamine-hydrolyzing), partial [Opitutaceae bacterium]